MAQSLAQRPRHTNFSPNHCALQTIVVTPHGLRRMRACVPTRAMMGRVVGLARVWLQSRRVPSATSHEGPGLFSADAPANICVPVSLPLWCTVDLAFSVRMFAFKCGIAKRELVACRRRRRRHMTERRGLAPRVYRRGESRGQTRNWTQRAGER